MIVIGERYGKLIPIEKLNKANKSDFWYLCKCDCGNTKIVRGTNLKSGHVKSCGCIRSLIYLKLTTAHLETGIITGKEETHYLKRSCIKDAKANRRECAV